MDIVVTGSVAYDYLMTFPGNFREHILLDRLDSISLSFLVDTMVRQRGGCAANIAYALGLFGESPRLMATVGQDFGEYRAWLQSKGVDTSAVKVINDKFTASFFANTDQSNAQICSFYTGAMANAGELSFKSLAQKPDLVVISPNDPGAMVQYARECTELGIPYLYDPSQQLPRLSGNELADGIKGAWALFVNDYEYGLIQEKTGMSEAKILGEVLLLVVTQGAKGARVCIKGREEHIPIVSPEKIVDPTGVGDAFRGGFLAGYAKGIDLILCVQMGTLTATYCLENSGTQNYTFTPRQFTARFRKHFSDNGALNALLDQG